MCYTAVKAEVEYAAEDCDSSLPDDENDLITLSPTSSKEEMEGDFCGEKPNVSIDHLNDKSYEQIEEGERDDDRTLNYENRNVSLIPADQLHKNDCFNLFNENGIFSHYGSQESYEEDGEPMGMGSTRQFCIREADNIYRCKICKRTYTHISNFCRHYMTTHKETKQFFVCPVCKKEFTRRDNMMTHLKGVHRVP